MMKKLSLAGIIIGLLMCLVAFAFTKADKSDFDSAKEIIAMRNISHQILLYTGDSISATLPVSRVSASEFQIPFKSSFSFLPDSLVSIIDKVISENRLPSNYVVSVLEKSTNKIIYGYAVLGPEEKSIVPCIGRDQPARPYYIDIKFKDNKLTYTYSGYAAGLGIMGIGFLLYLIAGYNRKKIISEPSENVIPPDVKTTVTIGKYLFNIGDQILKLDGIETVLTAKEAKILGIFAHAPNEVIDRKRLQKEIWEDEGVIVGRSLDMFISRLRKKLENDPDVKLINIHGRGYKLEVNNG